VLRCRWRKLATIPDAVPFEQAAALPLAGLTALRLARAAGHLASHRVLLTGASGGVGHYFVELAAAQGARVTAVSRTGDRGARLRELGAYEVVDDIHDARGTFDVGLDSVGDLSTAAVLTRLADRGLLIWFGQASRTPATIDFFDWQGGSNATIRKFHYAAVDDSADLATLARLVADDHLHPEIGLLSSWDQAPVAIAALVERRMHGNVVLTLTVN
jgi:NADPH2:quinone reductase